MVRRLNGVNPNEALLSMVALDLEDTSKITVATAGTAEIYAMKSEAPFIVLSADGAIYVKYGSGASSVDGFRLPSDTLIKLVSPFQELGHTGLSGAGPTISQNSGTATQFDVTEFDYYIEGQNLDDRYGTLEITKSAETGIAFTAAHTIGDGTGQDWGAILVQVDGAGTISTKVVGNAQNYATEEEAIDAMPGPDADNVAVGYITIQTTSNNVWTANTDDLDTGHANVAAINFYTFSTPEEQFNFFGPQHLGNPRKQRKHATISIDADSNGTAVWIAEVY